MLSQLIAGHLAAPMWRLHWERTPLGEEPWGSSCLVVSRLHPMHFFSSVDFALYLNRKELT